MSMLFAAGTDTVSLINWPTAFAIVGGILAVLFGLAAMIWAGKR